MKGLSPSRRAETSAGSARPSERLIKAGNDRPSVLAARRGGPLAALIRHSSAVPRTDAGGGRIGPSGRWRLNAFRLGVSHKVPAGSVCPPPWMMALALAVPLHLLCDLAQVPSHSEPLRPFWWGQSGEPKERVAVSSGSWGRRGCGTSQRRQSAST